MITFAFDESGYFEHRDSDETILIGGILYDDKGDPEDSENERARLIAFYQSICDQVGAVYPKHLHSNPYDNSNERAYVRNVKTGITDQLPEFLQKGTIFNGRSLNAVERAGEYFLFVFFKGKNGKTSLLKSDLNMLSKDDFASNLYIHMVEESINRTIFHNPMLDVTSVNFELTSRVAVIDSGSSEKEQEYADLGHHITPDSSRLPVSKFFLTNIDVFRTAIEREMLYSEKQSLGVKEISVKSIEYLNGNKDMAFLYLADVFCSFLQYKLYRVKESDRVDKICRLVTALTGRDMNLVFIYDDIDTWFDKAIRACETKDYYHTLSFIYEGMNSNSLYCEYYNKSWFPCIEDILSRETDFSMFSVALDYLNAYAHSNRIDQRKLMFIVNGLRKIAGHIVFPSEEDKKTLFVLYDIAASACNHMGYGDQAEENAKAAQKYIQYTDTGSIIRQNHKKVVTLCDSLKTPKALALAETTCDCAESLYKLRQKLIGDTSSLSTEYSIALSQLGQVYGYLRDDKAIDVFKKSLSLNTPGTQNYKITQSYLLHFYIDNRMQIPFDRLMQEYTEGTTDHRLQLRKILEMGSPKNGYLISVKFALYCYIKGLYTFHLSDISEELMSDLCDPDMLLKNAGYIGFALAGHPWQLIYKYLAFIFYKKGEPDKADSLMKTGNSCAAGGDIIEVISTFGKAQYADLKGDMTTCNAEAEKTFSIIKRLNDSIEHTDQASYYEELKDIITYTYV